MEWFVFVNPINTLFIIVSSLLYNQRVLKVISHCEKKL